MAFTGFKNYIVRSVVITVGISNDGQSRKEILGPKHRSRNHSVPCVPNSESVSKKILGCPRDPKLYLQFPISDLHWLGKEAITISFVPFNTNVILTIVFHIAPCLLCSLGVSIMCVLVTMVFPTKSQLAIPKPVPAKKL